MEKEKKTRTRIPLTESAAWLKSLFSSAPLGIGVERNHIVEEVNDRFLLLTGYALHEVIGKNIRIFFSDAVELERIERGLFTDSDEDGDGSQETRFLRKDGSCIDVLLTVAPIDSENESGRAHIFTLLDISDRKRVEQALEARISALTNPPEDAEVDTNIRFENLFDLGEIQKIQDAFSAATGVASIITDVEGTPITQPSNFTSLCMRVIRSTEIGCANCYRSDAALGQMNPSGPLMSPCLSGGLWDGGSGISVGNRHIANWLIGQVIDDSIDLEKVRAYAIRIGADQAEFDEALAQVPRMSKERFAKVCEALFLIARQLSTLAYRNAQQARAIMEKRKDVEEKDALYRELKHRIKNGLALIAGLVDLESGRATMSETRAALSSTRARIESMATLYDALGQTAAPTDVRLDDYLSRIVEVVGNTFSDDSSAVEFRLNFDGLVIGARSAAPLGLILMEILTNAIKYAFPDDSSGVVSITLRAAPKGAVELVVVDDGVGFPPGFVPEKSRGLGMELIRMLVAQLKGTLEIDNTPGARLRVRLPEGSARLLKRDE